MRRQGPLPRAASELRDEPGVQMQAASAHALSRPRSHQRAAHCERVSSFGLRVRAQGYPTKAELPIVKEGWQNAGETGVLPTKDF